MSGQKQQDSMKDQRNKPTPSQEQRTGVKMIAGIKALFSDCPRSGLVVQLLSK